MQGIPRQKNIPMHFIKSYFNLKLTGFGNRMLRTNSPFVVENPEKANSMHTKLIYLMVKL